METYVDELVEYLDVDKIGVLKDYFHYVDKDGNKGIKMEHTDSAGILLPDEQLGKRAREEGNPV